MNFLNKIRTVQSSFRSIKCSTNLTIIRNEGGFTDSSIIKTSMTQFKPEEGYALQITNVNDYGFTINSKIKALGPIAIFNKSIFSWNIEDINQINEKSLILFKLLEPKLDILIIGTGDKLNKINPDVPKWLIKNKITNFEILPTEKAINAFNFLVAEDRFVGGVFLPSAIRREASTELNRFLDNKNLYKEIEAKDNDKKNIS